MKIDDVILERIIDLAKESGYKPSGDLLKDSMMELMLIRFAHRIARELEPKNG